MMTRKLVSGAVVNDGGVAYILQSLDVSPLLDEDAFFDKTGLRLSWPARVGVLRLLQEDVLLQDVRVLIHACELTFQDQLFSLAEQSQHIAEQKLQKIANAVALVNEALPEVLDSARVL